MGVPVPKPLLRQSIAGMILLALSVGVQAREPVALKPLSPWNLQYQPESCRLVRAFGDAKHPTVLVLERISPDSSLSLLVFGGGLRSKVGDEGVTAAFLPFAANRFEAIRVAHTDKKKDPAIYWTDVSFREQPLSEEEEKAREERTVRDLAGEAQERAVEDRVASAIKALEIRGRRQQETVLETGPMGKALPMMRECARDQLTGWGLDPAVHDKIVRKATAIEPLNRMLRDSDYPDSAIRTGDESVIRARLLVDDKGAVSKCTSLSAYSAPGFADVVCARLKQARFTPAELADGTRVPDFTTINIRFQMPD
jgi:hypothetical protein